MSLVSRVALIGLGLIAAGVAAAFGASQTLAQAAEITLFLVNPANPELLIANETETEAKDIRYKIGLWNVDNLREGYRVLPIQGSGIVHLPPHHSYGPINLFDTPEIRAWLKPGNRIVGNVAATCRNCARGHTYWVLITWGKGGWFADIKAATNGDVIVPQDDWDTKVVRDHVLKNILLGAAAEIKQEDRFPIVPYAPPN